MGEYTVRVYACPVPFPFTFAAHTYLVVEHNGTTERYEVIPILGKSRQEQVSGHIHKDLLPPTTGFRCFGKYPFNFGPRYKTKCIGELSGGPSSAAHQLYEKIANGLLLEYPYKDQYDMIFGPNSNAFTQWVLDQVPDLDITLPRNAWGKKYRR